MSNKRVSLSFAYVSLVLLGTSLPLLVGWSHLPERVAMHWGLAGADGSASKLGAIVSLTLVGLLPLIGVRSKLDDGFRAPTALATLVFVGLLASGSSVLITAMNWGRSNWGTASEPGLLGMALLLGVPGAAAAMTYLLARRFYPEVRRRLDELPALSLAAGERAYWTGSADNRWLWPVAAGLAVLAIMTARAPSSFAVIPPLVGLLAVVTLARIRVTVSERAVEVRYGLLGWPRQRIALGEIRSAEAFDLVPLAHGGWGYRGSLMAFRRASIVVRAGLALRLELDGDRRLSITVDHADEAAKLINGFVARSGADVTRA